MWDRAHRAAACTARSCGRTVAPRRAATRCAPRATSRSCGPAPGSCSTRTSRRPSSSGCSREGGVERRRRPRVRHRRLVDPVEPHRRRRRRRARDRAVEREPHAAVRHRRAARGRDELLDAVRRPARRACPRCARAAGASASTAPDAAAGLARARSAASPATSRPRCSGRPASRPGMTKNTYGTGSFVLVNLGPIAPASGRRPAHHGRVDSSAPPSRTRSRARSS